MGVGRAANESARTILVTGAGRGIGAAIATRCAAAGLQVVVNYLNNHDAARETLRRVEAAGGDGILIQADVREEGDVRRLVKSATDAYGGIDALVNNAHTPFAPATMPEVEWPEVQAQIDGTLRSAFLCTKAALPFLRVGAAPAILNVSSVTVAVPASGFLCRDVAKAALEGLTRSVAHELAPLGIRVNALSAGWTETDQLKSMPAATRESARGSIPLRRFADPTEIAEAALFLISPRSSYLTGTVFPASGGLAPAFR